MSKITYPDPDILYDPISAMFNNRKWQNYNGDDPRVTLDKVNSCLYVHLQKCQSGNMKPFAMLEFKLERSTVAGVYLVTRFLVQPIQVPDASQQQGLLPGWQALEYFGKKIAGKPDDPAGDPKKFWTVSCAADVEALLRGYDRAALIYGCAPLFELP